MAKLLGEGSGVMENERGELTACMVRPTSPASSPSCVGSPTMADRPPRRHALQVGVYFPATMPRDTNAAETKAIGPWVDALLFEKNLRVGAGFHRGRWTARCSAQVFNDVRALASPLSLPGPAAAVGLTTASSPLQMSDFEAAARVISEVSVECARRLNEWRAKAVWSADGLDEAHGAVCF